MTIAFCCFQSSLLQNPGAEATKVLPVELSLVSFALSFMTPGASFQCFSESTQALSKLSLRQANQLPLEGPEVESPKSSFK